MFYNCFSVAVHHPGSFPSTPFPPSFYCFNSVTGVCSSYCVGAHGWITRICQPCKQSSSRGWLPIVEDPGCLRYTASILTMQLLNELFQTNADLQKVFLLYPLPHSTFYSLLIGFICSLKIFGLCPSPSPSPSEPIVGLLAVRCSYGYFLEPHIKHFTLLCLIFFSINRCSKARELKVIPVKLLSRLFQMYLRMI